MKKFFLRIVRTAKFLMMLVKYVLIIAVIYLTLFSTCCLFGSILQGDTSPEGVMSGLGIDISRGTVITDIDTHSGPFGDGKTFLEVRFSDDSTEKAMSENNLWKPLPLSENTAAFVYGDMSEKYHTAPHIHDENGKSLFPEIKNGYYCFIDRHDKAKDKYDDTDVLNRASCNYTIAIYDYDTDTLYYAKFDT